MKLLDLNAVYLPAEWNVSQNINQNWLWLVLKQSQWKNIWIAIYIFEVKFPSFASNYIAIMIYFKVLVKLFLQNCDDLWLYNFVDQLWENVSCYLRVRPTGKQGQLKVKISQLYSLLFQRPNVMTTVVLYHTLEFELELLGF